MRHGGTTSGFVRNVLAGREADFPGKAHEDGLTNSSMFIVDSASEVVPLAERVQSTAAVEKYAGGAGAHHHTGRYDC